MREKLYYYWLSCVPCLGPKKIASLLEHIGTPEEIYSASEESLRQVPKLCAGDVEQIVNSRNQDKIQRDYERMTNQGIRYVHIGEEYYPKRLQHIDAPPFGLFFRGTLPSPKQKLVAVVGARNASNAGLSVANSFCRELAENGIAVISGLARGIDIAAHKGVLSVAGGRTYGVLGCGVDICYPKGHIESYMLMQDHGGVISEFSPGMPPYPGNFPQRNRIISGLADGVLVIEAGNKSGSLITARLGLDQGKDLFVVPGALFDPCYEGSNRLIQTGAALVTSTRDILDGLGIFLDEDVSTRKKKCEVVLESTEKIVYSYLSLEPIHLSEIARISGISAGKVMETLLSMELKGVVKSVGNHYYSIVL